MPSAYLAPGELNTYGVPNATAAQIIEASNIVDAYLRRPMGLQWMPDYAGIPCYMAALSPAFSLTISAGISAGTNVVVPIPSTTGLSITGQVGTVVVLDRASSQQGQTGICEATYITAVTNTSVTLNKVVNTHPANVVMDFGLVISEQKTLPQKRSVARLGSWPIVRIISLLGSYRYGRRDDQQGGLYADQSVLSLMQTFGGPPEWIQVDPTAGDWGTITNETWIPSGIFLAYYSDVRVHYVAGYSQSNIPPAIKTATARIIEAGVNTAQLVGGIKMARAGDTALERFANTLLDDDTKAMLLQYRARAFV